MNVRLVDISKETGFSVNTVSRALRNDKRISDSTTLQIKKVAEKLGYIPNNVASSMRSQFSNI
ncbi:MAG TPA: LacI family transcriptional regulator, partial [Clostridiales bacterium]|nr:LacI family transcriptional regulator [Clostridiales bacterium]